MRRRIGSVPADIFPPENPKFRSPLILVHGLWSGAAIWRGWATHASNLGWECWAIDFRGRPSFQDCVNDLENAARAAPHPPVIVAHGFGGLVAMKAAETGELSALVLAAPLPPAQVKSDPTRLFRLLRLKYSPLIFLRRPFRLQEKDFVKGWLSRVAEDHWPFAFESLVPDAACLIKEFFHRTVAIDSSRIRCPILILAGDQDPLVSPSAFEETASVLGGRLLTFPRHGHLLMAEAEGQKMVRAVHRWLVQELGEDVLLAQLRPDAEPRT